MSLCPCFVGPLFSCPPGTSVPTFPTRGRANAFAMPARTKSASIVPAGMKPAGKGFGHLPRLPTRGRTTRKRPRRQPVFGTDAGFNGAARDRYSPYSFFLRGLARCSSWVAPYIGHEKDIGHETDVHPVDGIAQSGAGPGGHPIGARTVDPFYRSQVKVSVLPRVRSRHSAFTSFT